MRNSNIKRVLSAALLLAFAAPSTTAITTSEYGASDASLNRSSMVLSGDVRLTNRNDQITLSLRDSDVKQVLRMFADKAGMNIVFHDSVSGKVTLDLVKTPINEAFNLVLNISGLNYYKQGNTMIVMSKTSPDNATFSKQEMYTFPVNYVNAGKIAQFLNTNVFGMKRAGLSGIDAATVNSATNELIVFGMPSDVAIVEKVIAQFDKEPLSRTFSVNHTTPAQMADMICNVLLPSRGIGGNDAASNSQPAYFSSGNETGGASNVGNTSSSSSSGSAGTLSIGEGVVACSVSAAGGNGSVAPFDVPNLSVAYFPQRGTITIMGGSEAQANMIANFIKTNDVKQPQAILELSIVELNEAGSKAFQNQWAISSKAWGFKFDGQSTSGGRSGGMGDNMIDMVEYTKVPGEWSSDHKEYTPPQFIETPIKVAMPATTYIQWTMNYLIENRKARVLANPKIMITNGQESVIDLTQDYVEKVDTEFLTSTSAGSGSTTGTVQREYSIEEDLGIKVSLTPFISPEGYVTLNITPDYSTIANQYFDEYGLPAATLLSRRNLDLKNIRIKDGETLVLGGMIQEQEQKTTSKIPVLGDLPVIGAAFRSTSTSKQKTELVIMITPRIINDDEGSVANNL